MTVTVHHPLRDVVLHVSETRAAELEQRGWTRIRSSPAPRVRRTRPPAVEPVTANKEQE